MRQKSDLCVEVCSARFVSLPAGMHVVKMIDTQVEMPMTG